MEYVTKGYEPADALRYFEELSAIPRGSRNEKAAAEFVMQFAKDLGLWCRMDDAYNVVVKKPASPGCEGLPTVMLQGHLDMVCEKNQATEHDFEKDPLKLQVKDGILRASGTTLGADNGVAVAYMMAALARDDYRHPALECVFTSMEEIGLLGAIALDCSDLEAKYLLNMDCGPEGTMIVSSAGGLLIDFEKSAELVPFAGEAVSLAVRGLLGGHSAMMIDQEMGNSIKLMGRVLHNIKKAMPVNLVSLSGGSKMNAIPRESDALIAVPAGRADEAIAIAQRVAGEISSELAASDPGFALQAAAAEPAAQMMDSASSDELIRFVYLLPNAVYTMSMEIPGLVVTSGNLGVAVSEGNTVKMTEFIRSSDPTVRDHMADEMATLAEMCRVKADINEPMAGWKYEANSPLRELCMKIYKEQTGKEMEMKAVHGGLECGILKDKLPALDIIAFGPTADGAHTPDECLDLASFQRTFAMVMAVLEALAK
ncbi:beta-Ala-His dipeptidase [Oscillospiraceae bacterium 52-8]|nr:beta-Ala-His dipeptidase [bacterium 210820-DFI.6.52]